MGVDCDRSRSDPPVQSRVLHSRPRRRLGRRLRDPAAGAGPRNKDRAGGLGVGPRISRTLAICERTS